MSADHVSLPDEPARTTAGFVRVRGARDHNLKNVDVDMPRDCLVVFTGISGSGKSSLAFGTLYAEAQRRYFESVAPYARRLIEQVGVPDVDSIEGLPPAVALQQQRGPSSTRSSVGSITTLSDLLRMLYSRAGNYPARQPMLYAEDFSANTPQGACPTCHGVGRVYEVTEKAMVPDDSLSIRDRAIAAWPPAWQGQNLRDILVTLGYDVDRPWRELPRKDRDWILFTDEQPTVPVYPGLTPTQTRQALRRKREPDYQGTFMGARKYVLHTFSTTQSELMKKRASRFMTGSVCPECHGKRLKHASLTVTFAGHDIGEISQMPLTQLAKVLKRVIDGDLGPAPNEDTLGPAAVRKATERRIAAGGAAHSGSPDVRRTPNLSEEKRIAAQRMSQNMLERITTLQELGLGYLSLDRITPTLSPGELQRLRLATQIRSSLFGVVYVLDEPSAGLHPADTEALLRALDLLKHSGNSLFVVEHDLEVMRHADWIVDVGPDAGERGGQVLYSGPLDGLRTVQSSHTARYLFSTPEPCKQVLRAARGWLKLRGVTRNNIQDVDVDFPLGVFTTITGVSGSGKSSLASQALVELLSTRIGQAVQSSSDEADDMELTALTPAAGYILSGADQIKRLVTIDQKPIGRTPRSNLATYTGLFDHVRRLFAATHDAKLHRYNAGRFSFNVAKGRCATCEGQGSVSVELLFMPSVYAPCPTCHGARYNEQTLKIRYRDRNVAEVLGMSVEEAYDFFTHEAAVQRPLRLLRDIGLGYLGLGQPATELSGGEAQRIKLATELQRLQHGDTLYVIDEPTIGLHPADVDKLMVQLDALVDAGNSVIVAEHEMRVVAASDWIIEMGPGAGDQGGKIVASGAPHEIRTAKHSRTAPYLARYLEGEAHPHQRRDATPGVAG